MNSHISPATNLSPFECCLGYQPPLFPSQELQVGVQSAEAFIRRCKQTWRATHANLQKAAARMKQQADRKRKPAPEYRVGQRVWLSTKDIPIRGNSEACTPVRVALPPHRPYDCAIELKPGTTPPRG